MCANRKKIASYIEDIYNQKIRELNSYKNNYEKKRVVEIAKEIKEKADLSDLEVEVQSLMKKLNEVVKKIKGKIRKVSKHNGYRDVVWAWSLDDEIQGSAHQVFEVEKENKIEQLIKEKMDVLTRLELAEGRAEVEAIAREVGLLK